MALTDIAVEVKQQKLTYLSDEKMQSLYDCIESVKAAGVPGNFLEFGVALGGSAICLASELDGDRKFLGFDVFSMIPSPSERDGEASHKRYDVIKSGKSAGIKGDPYYGYRDNLYDTVCENFTKFGMAVDGNRISLVKGLFDQTLPKVQPGAIAVAHIDCDWYDPVLCCLTYVFDLISVNGFIVLDDYNDYPGCKQAVNDFRRTHPGLKLVRTRPRAVFTKAA